MAAIQIQWGKAGDNKWQKLGDACDQCGPDGCLHTHPPTGLEQSLDEMEFTRSACSAALNGDADKLRRCLDRNPSCIYHDGAEGNSGYTPLHYAARGGHAECVSLLLQAGASVLARTQGGATPLMRAAFAGHTSVCAQLLRAKSAADAQDSDGETPLHKAAQQQHAATLAALLKAHPAAGDLWNRHGKLPSDLLRGKDE
jgi:hypothetical protein